MLLWTQVLSWTLICSLGQGFVVYSALWLILKLIPASASGTRYRLSLTALVIVLLWFGATLWHEFNVLSSLNNTTPAGSGGTVFYITDQQVYTPAGTTGLAALTQPLAYGLAVAYLAGLLFMLARLSSGLAQLFYIGRRGLQQPSNVLYELLASSKAKLKLKRPIRLFITVKSQVPMVIGFIKPMIVLPAATIMQLSPEQLETILLHELAHIRRNDFLVNVLQTIAETILFCNPFVWLTSMIIRREREHCCDDLVLAHITEPVYYARALSTLAGQYTSNGNLAVAASGQSYQLLHRIKRIMELKKSPFSYSRIAAAILTVTLITATTIRFSSSFAMGKKNEAAAALTMNSEASAATETEEAILVRQLSNDNLVSEAKGFVIEKKEGKLFIDYKVVATDIARKYLSATRKKEMRIQVYPLQERIKRHPGSSLLQLAAPIQMSSQCVDYSIPKKDGC